MEVRAQQLIYGVAEVIAAHNLLAYVKKNDGTEKVRMAVGASMAGLGYVCGPELEERIRNLKDSGLDEKMKQQLIYAAGGAVLGSLAGYHVGPKVMQKQIMEKNIRDTITPHLIPAVSAIPDVTAPEFDRKQPGGLLTIASAGWLGYSLFFDGKTEEEKQRHLWGLGAGVIGYMYGPEMLRKVKGMVLPVETSNSALDVYARGSALIGGIAGGVLGWYKGETIVQHLREE